MSNYLKAGNCTAKQIREYLKSFAPDARIERIETFKDTIHVTLDNGDVIIQNKEKILHKKHDYSTRADNEVLGRRDQQESEGMHPDDKAGRER